MNPVVDLTVDGLCAYRLTRLVTTDEITAPLRLKVERAAMRSEVEDGIAAKIKILIGCPWCSSPYLAIFVLCLDRVPGGRMLKKILALSAVAGLLSIYADG